MCDPFQISPPRCPICIRAGHVGKKASQVMGSLSLNVRYSALQHVYMRATGTISVT